MTTTTAPFTPRAEMEAAFIRSIAENPDDLDTQAMIYADWLYDEGLDGEAEFVRLEGRPAGSSHTKVVRQYKYTLLRLRCSPTY
jgi:uncharacterized protein (TIGR02996 family)